MTRTPDDLDRLARLLGLTRASDLGPPRPASGRTSGADTVTRAMAPVGFRVIERIYPAGHHHGGFEIGLFRGLPRDALRRLCGDGMAPDLDPLTVGFLDTETTGLRAGPGGYAFLVGLGHFDTDGYRLRQFFLGEPAAELEMLGRLTDALGRLSALLTFNGRSFDLPYLEERLVQNRLPPLPRPYHVDLLPLARSLFGRRLGSCRLVALEERLLGMSRHDDIPSSLVPEAYFRYAHHGDGQALERVLEHNASDIVSLSCLAVLVHRTIEGDTGHALDVAAAGLLAGRRGASDRAWALLERALSMGLEGATAREAHRTLARVHRRCGRLDAAERHLQALVDTGTLDALPYVQLARIALARRDHDVALERCRQGLTRMGRAAALLGRTADRGRQRLVRLAERIESRRR